MDRKLPFNFFTIYISNIFIGIGIGLFMMFILLSMWHYYGSALIASLPFIIMAAVPSLLSPIVGTHVDKYPKHKIGLLSISLSIISLLPLFFMANIYLILTVFVILILLESYYGINYSVCVRNIVGDEHLIYANNLWVVSIGITYVIAYILGAYLYTYMSFYFVLIIALLSYFISLIFWIFSKIPEPSRKKETKKIKYREIFKELRKKPELVKFILIYDTVFLFAVIIKSPAYITYCFNILKMSSFTYGIYSGFNAFLFVLVPLTIHKFIKNKKN